MIDYSTLKEPGLRMIYAILSGTAVPGPEHRRAQFQQLADTFPNGWHEVGWYMHWLAVDRYDLSVLIQYNRIFAERTVEAYLRIPHKYATVAWEKMLGDPVYLDRIDTPPVLRYVLQLRDDPGAAASFLCQHPIPILSAYIGKPGLRACIDPEAEERLWTHAASLCVYCTQP